MKKGSICGKYVITFILKGVMKLFFNQGFPVVFRPEGFQGRDEILEVLHRVARMGRFGEGGCVLCYGRPDIGKTSVLLKLKEELVNGKEDVEEGNTLFPFYFSFSRILSNPFRLAHQYILEYLWQLLSFLGDSPGGGGFDALALGERLSARGFSVPYEQIKRVDNAVKEKDPVSAVAIALSFPFAFEKKGISDVYIFDDFQYTMRLTDLPEWVVLSILRPYIKSGTFPLIISGSSPGLVTASLKKEGLFGSFNTLEVGNLDRKSAVSHVEYLLKKRGFTFDQGIVEKIADRSGGVPVYQRLFVDDLVFRGEEPADEGDVERLYALSVVEGKLNNYWREFFESCFSGRKQIAGGIRFLKRVLVDEFPIDTYDGALGLIGGDVVEGEAILSALEFKGVAKCDYDVIRFIRDPVLSDFLFWAYERAVLRKPNDQVISQILEMKLLKDRFPRPDDKKEELISSVKSLVRKWDCQEIPSSLLDFISFRERYGDMGPLEVVIGVEEEKMRYRLPRMSSVSTGYMVGGKLPRVDFDVVGFGFRNREYSESALVIWALDLFPGPFLDRKRVEHFENRCRLLSLEKSLTKEQLVKWVLFDGKAEESALSFAAKNGIFLTHVKQLKILFNLFGMEEGSEEVVKREVEARKGKTEEEGPLEFDLVIPMREDSEVIAARVAEEIAYFRDVDRDTIDRVKMAIIEACINAFEHSGAEAGNVKLRYVIGQDRLEVFITDEGKGLKTQDSPGVVSDARRERGWGLKIIKELVDDVDIVTGDGGTTVRMVKYLDRSPREKASPEGGETGIGEKERNEGGNGSEET